MTFVDRLILMTAVGGLIYVVGQAVVFRQIESISYWEARGYINGLVRGAGDRDSAINQLDIWRNWWIERAWWKGLVDNLYNYGLQRVQDIYG